MKTIEPPRTTDIDAAAFAPASRSNAELDAVNAGSITTRVGGGVNGMVLGGDTIVVVVDVVVVVVVDVVVDVVGVVVVDVGVDGDVVIAGEVDAELGVVGTTGLSEGSGVPAIGTTTSLATPQPAAMIAVATKRVSGPNRAGDRRSSTRLQITRRS